MVISFKNVGIKEFKQENVLNRNQSELPIGVKTPIELGFDGNGIFKMNTTIKDQVSDNLRNLLLTNWGERVGNYFFGANLRPILVDYSSKEDFDQEAMIRINTAVSKWMPFITPIAFDSSVDRTNNLSTGIVKIVFIYSVQALGITNSSMEVTLYVI